MSRLFIVHCIPHFKTKDCSLIPNRHKQFLFSPNHPDWLHGPASLPINGHQQLLKNPSCCTFHIIYIILMCIIIQINATFHCVHQFDSLSWLQHNRQHVTREGRTCCIKLHCYICKVCAVMTKSRLSF